jgi:hypothetical protein
MSVSVGRPTSYRPTLPGISGRILLEKVHRFFQTNSKMTIFLMINNVFCLFVYRFCVVILALLSVGFFYQSFIILHGDAAPVLAPSLIKVTE